MNTSDWIAIGSIAVGLFITIIGSALVLSFKIGGLNEKMTTMEKAIEKLTEAIDQTKVTIAAMLVKLDVLWTEHTLKPRSPKKGVGE